MGRHTGPDQHVDIDKVPADTLGEVAQRVDSGDHREACPAVAAAIAACAGSNQGREK